MLKDIVDARPLDGHRFHVRFEDGLEGEVDLVELVELTGVFGVLRDPAEFRKLAVDSGSGTVCWPNGADLDPDVLYARVAGREFDLPRAAPGRPLRPGV
jgi:hypothetical protein